MVLLPVRALPLSCNDAREGAVDAVRTPDLGASADGAFDEVVEFVVAAAPTAADEREEAAAVVVFVEFAVDGVLNDVGEDAKEVETVELDDGVCRFRPAAT